MGVAARPMPNIAHLWSDTKDRIDDRMAAVVVVVVVVAAIALANGKGVAEEAADETTVPRITADAIGLIGWMGKSVRFGSVLFRLCSVFFRALSTSQVGKALLPPRR